MGCGVSKSDDGDFDLEKQNPNVQGIIFITITVAIKLLKD